MEPGDESLGDGGGEVGEAGTEPAGRGKEFRFHFQGNEGLPWAVARVVGACAAACLASTGRGVGGRRGLDGTHPPSPCVATLFGSGVCAAVVMWKPPCIHSMGPRVQGLVSSQKWGEATAEPEGSWHRCSLGASRNLGFCWFQPPSPRTPPPTCGTGLCSPRELTWGRRTQRSPRSTQTLGRSARVRLGVPSEGKTRRWGLWLSPTQWGDPLGGAIGAGVGVESVPGASHP